MPGTGLIMLLIDSRCDLKMVPKTNCFFWFPSHGVMRRGWSKCRLRRTKHVSKPFLRFFKLRLARLPIYSRNVMACWVPSECCRDGSPIAQVHISIHFLGRLVRRLLRWLVARLLSESLCGADPATVFVTGHTFSTLILLDKSWKRIRVLRTYMYVNAAASLRPRYLSKLLDFFKGFGIAVPPGR